MTINVLTIMETAAGASLAPPELERIVATPPPARAAMPTAGVPRPAPSALLPVTVTPVPTTAPAAPQPADANGDELFSQLNQNGRVVMPFVFPAGPR